MPGNRKSSLLQVPERGNPDRRRALNVLAQRRYRQRRRERIGALERKVKEISAPSESTGSSSTLPDPETPSDDAEIPEMLQSNSHPNWNFSNATQVLAGSATDVALSSGPLDTWYHVTDQSFGFGNFDQSTNMSPCGLDEDDILALINSTPMNLESNPMQSNTDLGSELQSLESLQFTFPDDAELHVPELKIMKAAFTAAQLLGCEQSIWDVNAMRVFDMTLWQNSSLPLNLKPTEAQMRIPHHPLFDILPWPSLRSKLIYVFSLPVEIRPPPARDPLALMNMAYDMDDSAEGFRVNGPDEFDSDNWEVGQLFFANWWWALDRSIVQKSNSLRARRGANRLQLMPA